MAPQSKTRGGHLVFTWAGSANRHTGIPHFDSKCEVEKHIADRLGTVGRQEAITATAEGAVSLRAPNYSLFRTGRFLRCKILRESHSVKLN